MRPEPTSRSDSAETTLPSACMLCGGVLELKVTGTTARTYCKACHWVGQPEVTSTFNGLKVTYKPVGKA
jgi:hypothetical protein